MFNDRVFVAKSTSICWVASPHSLLTSKVISTNTGTLGVWNTHLVIYPIQKNLAFQRPALFSNFRYFNKGYDTDIL